MKKKILIIGISGQDGAYLAKLYLDKKIYEVHGIVRSQNNPNLETLGIRKLLKIHLIKNFKDSNRNKLIKILKINFDKIFFFGGQSSVKDSFKDKEYETYESQILPVREILEYLRKSKKKTKFLFAASSEMYGDMKKKKISERSKTEALSPYALSKIASYEIIKSYRLMFNLPVFSMIFFNHESDLRRKDYVIKKIILGVKNIKKGKQKKIVLGNINVKRDWGWAPEFMNICYKAINHREINDYVLATGQTVSLKHVIMTVFKINNLNWKNHVDISKNHIRTSEIRENYANISFIKKKIKNETKIKNRANFKTIK